MDGKGQEAPAIGIDLGTTNSCVAVWMHGQDRVEVIANEHGNRTTPSYVSFGELERETGDGAKNHAFMDPYNTVFDAKRLIGRRFSDSSVQEDMRLWPFKVIEGPADTSKLVVKHNGEEKQFLAEEISSMVLRKMKESAEAYLGKAVKNAVITVPAYFNDSQRQATKNAGINAGLNVLRMINEPTAAAIAYGLDNKSYIDGKINTLIFDLGGGTFDVVLISIEEGGIFEVKAVGGDTHLGGEDFNNHMVDHCVQEFKRKWNIDLTGDKKALGWLRFACEKAKRTLSGTSQAIIEVYCLHKGIDFSMNLTRSKFEELNMELFNKCIKKLDICLSDAKVNKSCVDQVVLVGGSTRIPKVQHMLQEFFDDKILCKSVNPDEVVAHGAAIMASKLCGNNDKSVQDVVIRDVIPLSLGIETKGYIYSVIIPRNTPMPISNVRTYKTSLDNLTGISIKLYQGERSKSTYNHFLGNITISGIPPAPKGVQKVTVCFEIDANGILTVSAGIISNGKTEKLTIANANQILSTDQIEKIINDAEVYKVDDQEFKKTAETRTALEDYLYKVKNLIKNKVQHKKLKEIEKAMTETTKWLKDNQSASFAELQFKMEHLEFVCKPLFQSRNPSCCFPF